MEEQTAVPGSWMTKRDLYWGAGLAVSSIIFSTVIGRLSGGGLYFYQFFMPETVYLACQGAVGHPGTLHGPLDAFLTYQASSFDCSDLPPDVGQGRLGVFSQAHLYLVLSVSAFWWLFSPSLIALWPLAAGLYAAYVVGCFALIRLFFPRGSAIAGTLLLAVSPTTLALVPHMRDFSKGPFIVWGLVLLIAAARPAGFARQTLLAVAAGLVTGVGFGFRSDVAILIPVAVLFFLTAASERRFSQRISFNAAFLLAFALAASPMLMAGKAGHLGAMAMEGATDPFNNFLGLEPAPYSWGARYSDELTLSSIAAELRPVTPGWDEAEAPPAFGLSQAISESSSYLLARADLIIGDTATRALKSAASILAYPSLARSAARLDPAYIGLPGNRLLEWLNDVYRFIGKLWIIPVGLAGFAAFMLREYTLRPRQVIVLALSLGVLLGYPALQFSIRHIFHLEFAWVLSLLGLIHVARRPRAYVERLPRFILGSGAAAVAIGGVYLALLSVQDSAMKGALHDLMEGPSQDIATTVSRIDDKAVFTVPVPDEHLALVNSPPDSMAGKKLPISAQWDVRAGVDRLVVTLGGADCALDSVELSLDYEKGDVWQPMDEVRTVPLTSPSEGPTKFLFPAFYRSTQHFASLSVPWEALPCVLSVERLQAPTRLPSVITAILPPDWHSQRQYLGL